MIAFIHTTCIRRQAVRQIQARSMKVCISQFGYTFCRYRSTLEVWSFRLHAFKMQNHFCAMTHINFAPCRPSFHENSHIWQILADDREIVWECRQPISSYEPPYHLPPFGDPYGPATWLLPVWGPSSTTITPALANCSHSSTKRADDVSQIACWRGVKRPWQCWRLTALADCSWTSGRQVTDESGLRPASCPGPPREATGIGLRGVVLHQPQVPRRLQLLQGGP